MPGAYRQKATAYETTPISNNTDSRIVYNGFTFPKALSTTLSSRPVSTTSERATKRIDYTLNVDCILAIDDFKTNFDGSYSSNNLSSLGKNALTDPTDYTMDYVYQTLVRHLTAKGEALTVYGTGIGQIYIEPNRSDSLQNDINNGPTPSRLEIVRIDAAKVLHINWSVNFSLSPCDNNQTFGGIKVNEFDFSIHYTVDNAGMMVRNVYGTVEFPNYVSRGYTKFNPEDGVSSGKGIKDKILTSFPIPAGFERRSDFTTNPNRTRIQFSITDTEIPSDNPYFPGTVRMDATHTVNNSNKAPLSNESDANQALPFDSVISGSVEVAPGRDKYWGWNAIVSIIRSRLDIASQNYYMGFFGITENIYGRRLTFHISYQTTFNPNEFFDRTKLFQPIKNFTGQVTKVEFPVGDKLVPVNINLETDKPVLWEEHNEDRKNYTGAFGYDGISVFKPEESVDKVITLCDNPENSSNLPKTTTGEKKEGTDKKKPQEKKENDKTYQKSPFATNVTSPKSYIRYNNKTRIESSFNVAVHGIIGRSDAGKPKDEVVYNDQDKPATFIEKGVKLTSNREKTEQNVMQTRGTGNHYLVMEGSAVRVGFRVSIPRVESIQGVKGDPLLLQENIVPSQLAGWTADGIPIYEAFWKRIYCLPQLGAEVTLAAVPVQFQTNDEEFTLPSPTTRNLPSSANRNS